MAACCLSPQLLTDQLGDHRSEAQCEYRRLRRRSPCAAALYIANVAAATVIESSRTSTHIHPPTTAPTTTHATVSGNRRRHASGSDIANIDATITAVDGASNDGSWIRISSYTIFTETKAAAAMTVASTASAALG